LAREEERRVAQLIGRLDRHALLAQPLGEVEMAMLARNRERRVAVRRRRREPHALRDEVPARLGARGRVRRRPDAARQDRGGGAFATTIEESTTAWGRAGVGDFFKGLLWTYWTMRASPRRHASTSNVAPLPSLSGSSRFAPRSPRNRATSKWPFCTAPVNAVLPPSTCRDRSSARARRTVRGSERARDRTVPPRWEQHALFRSC
jgi:hypothetical protein